MIVKKPIAVVVENCTPSPYPQDAAFAVIFINVLLPGRGTYLLSVTPRKNCF